MNRNVRPVSCLLALVAGLTAPVQAQKSEPPTPSQTIYSVLVAWAAAFDAGKIDLRHNLVFGDKHPVYADTLTEDGLFYRSGGSRRTHLWALQQLLFQAERRKTVPMARAVLAAAAVGIDRSLYDPQVQQVRELSHWAVMRMDDKAVWLMLMRVAAGDPLASMPWFKNLKEKTTRDPALRVAAIRLLGDKNQSVFRPVVETGLIARDPRVRLAAAEAVGRMGRRQSLPLMLRAMRTEKHGVVAQALLHGIERQLKRNRSEITQDLRQQAVRACIRMLGRSHWRVEMTVVGILAAYPCRDSIPALIQILKRRDTDALRKAVNKNASPLLRYRAWQALRKLTGAVVPQDARAWEEFWEKEKDRVVLVDPDRQRPAYQTRAKSTFYGIPVLGQEIVFLIDTSGSMKEPANAGQQPRAGAGRKAQPKAGRRPRPRARRRQTGGRKPQKSRLDHAKEQILAAVQSMDLRSRYHLMTFSSDVRIWSKKPVPPGKRSYRALTECVNRIMPGGGTNVCDAVLHALQPGGGKFGQLSKNNLDELFLMSDGLPSSGPVTEPEEILKLVRQANRYLKVRINTVFTGQGPGADFLRQLAEENGGVFVRR